jgi:hypothetical protein
MRGVPSDERGQSVYDYAIGVSLFLVVVFGVFAFLPTAFDSVEAGTASGADEVAAERTADYLVETAFTNASAERLDRRPRVSCVVALYEDGTACGFGAGTPLAVDAGLTRGRPINVTVETDRDTGTALCWDGDGNRLVPVTSPDCTPSSVDDVSFRNAPGGSNAAQNQEFATAVRSAHLGDRDVYVVVRTW